MRKYLPQHIVLVLLLSLFTLSGYSQDYLKADGTSIKKGEEEIIFRGIGLGGWMLQEGYMLGTSGPQHELEARVEELVGTEKKEEFYDAWLANHVQKVDIDSMAAWGYNLVRLPMHYKLFTPPIEEEPVPGEITWLDKGFEMTDDLLAWCKANGLYLILDLHAAPGGQGENADISDYDPSKPSLWESEENQAKTVALWRKLAERYADEPMIAGYDIINEPNWGFENHSADPNGCSEAANTLLWQLQEDITTAIREVDENHIVIIEGNCWGNNYNGLPTLWDDNLVISYHKYWNNNDQNAIQGMLDMRESRNVPIWLGETGENSNTWFTNAISLFESNNIGWCWWPLKKLGSNNPLQIKRSENYQAILDYWNNGATKPAESDAYAGLMQLAEDLKLENNIYHKGVVDAKIRQPHTDETVPFVSHKILPEGENIIFITDYDLGKNGFAYFDKVSSNTTGNAGGATWNTGYSYRNDGVDIEACQDETTNGYNVGWTEDDEWLLYTVEVQEEGNYQLNLRTASASGNGRVSLFIDDVRSTETIALPNTGDYQSWETTTVEDVYLKEGTNRLKVYINQGGFNINYMQLVGPEETSAQPKLLEKSGTHQKKRIGLLFNQAFETIPADHGFSLAINGEAATISEVALEEDVPQAISITLESQLDYYDEVLLSYSNDGIVTKSGVVLAEFTDLEIDVLLEDGNIPHTIPGKIEAEDFVVNNGFETEQTSDVGGGLNLGYTDAGDYLEYFAEVTQRGYYKAEYRVASQDNGGGLTLKTVATSGSDAEISSVQFDATGGWQNWSTEEGADAYLDEGLYTLRLIAEAPLFNINWIRLTFLYEEKPVTDLEKPRNFNLLSIYPNPAVSTFYIKFNISEVPDRIILHDQAGRKILELTPAEGSDEVEINRQLDPGLYTVTTITKGQIGTQKIFIQ